MKKIALPLVATATLTACSSPTDLTGRILWTKDGCAYSVSQSSAFKPETGKDIAAHLNRTPDLDAPECSAPPRP